MLVVGVAGSAGWSGKQAVATRQDGSETIWLASDVHVHCVGRFVESVSFVLYAYLYLSPALFCTLNFSLVRYEANYRTLNLLHS